VSLLNNVFKCPHDPLEIKWILTNPYNTSELNSYVAVYGEEIVAHCGYVLNLYQQFGKTVEGKHPIALCSVMRKETRGIGTKLFEQVSTMKDFALGYAGTAASTRSYKRFGAKTAGLVKSYQTMLNWPSVSEFIASESIKSVVRLLYRSVREKIKLHVESSIGTHLRFSDWDKRRTEDLPKSEVLQNIPSKELILWLMQCPYFHEVFVKRISNLNRENLGLLICATAKISKGLHGRILHMPLLDTSSELWCETLQYALIELRSRGCSDVTVCATHEGLVGVLESSGLVQYEQRPVVFLDRNNVINEKNIHLSFIEGDHHYRNM